MHVLDLILPYPIKDTVTSANLTLTLIGMQLQQHKKNLAKQYTQFFGFDNELSYTHERKETVNHMC